MSILDFIISVFIISVFVAVADKLRNASRPVAHHSQQKLSPSELVTLGILYALKAVPQKRFYAWLKNNYSFLFPALPERTRLFRRLATRQAWTDLFLAKAGLLGIIDSYGVEMVHPRREGRDDQSCAKKGLSNKRWIVGVKVAVLVNHLGHVVDWQWLGANTHDKHFRDLVSAQEQTAILADGGFHGKSGDPENLNICGRGQANQRFLIETVFSLWTGFLGLKSITEQRELQVEMHLSFAIAAFNLIQSFWEPEYEGGRVPLKMADICL